MSTIAAASPTVNHLYELKTKLKATWMAGNYDLFSRYMEPDARIFYNRIGVQPKQHLLDVACGAGQLALIAVRAGAHVTGCDISTNWIERARERAALENLCARFDEADAESLPYANGQFDVVTSLFGAMFAPQPELVASEMMRVCRPGGKIVMANWTAQGFVGQMFKLIAKYIAPNGMPSPLLWGDEAVVRERFGHSTTDMHFAYRFNQFEYPFPPETVVEFFRENYGPMKRAFETLTPHKQEGLKAELVSLWASNNRAEGNGTLVDAEYLEVTAHCIDATTEISVGRQQQPNRRAAMLADRIEEGAARLEEFVTHLTDKEWNTPLVEGGKPGRSVGVIVHHVANMYPIEIEAAKVIAAGNPITHITWEVVSDINGKHAAEQADVSKSDAIMLLRKNSKEAADAVRNMTDTEMDRAAPFSLSYGAPVTAQFVIEDHAMRHSWHHLARIRKALGHKVQNPSSLLQ